MATRREELSALRRLDERARALERHATGPGVAQLIADEHAHAHAYGGRTVFGWARPPSEPITETTEAPDGRRAASQ
jgi:hypothetical protein